MTKPRTYSTAGAFRRALEERLRIASQADQVDINRLRRQISFDRLLARLFWDDRAPWALKGGYALELRFRSARSTIDIDLTVARAFGSSTEDVVIAVREMLQAAATVALDDWFEYTIGPPITDVTAAPYGGARFSIEARMDGRIFARFYLDAGIGDVLIQPLETIDCPDWLGFAGIPRARVRMISREQQLAEKIHAYTLPRSSPNSRVKDLVDIAILINESGLDERLASNSLRLTFERRNTHSLPDALTSPPQEWQIPFDALARDCGLQRTLDEAFQDVSAYYGKVLKPRTEQ